MFGPIGRAWFSPLQISLWLGVTTKEGPKATPAWGSLDISVRVVVYFSIILNICITLYYIEPRRQGAKDNGIREQDH